MKYIKKYMKILLYLWDNGGKKEIFFLALSVVSFKYLWKHDNEID